jgi:UDP-N-acetylmuramate dehydrogenase
LRVLFTGRSAVPLGVSELEVVENAPVRTWFGVGGGADRLARPRDVEQVLRCLEMDPGLRVLGEGANLLVDDDGVGELVVDTAGMNPVQIDPAGRVVAMAGARLPKLITDTVRAGLGGLECLGGIPASVGGAVIMNAGGAFGQIADVVSRVWALDREGREVVLERGEIGFGYRASGLGGLIVMRVEFALEPGDAGMLRGRLKEVMAYKKGSQPLAEDSAGCVFKNPVLERDVEGVGRAGERVSAGMLIERAGCMGMVVGGARVSDRHANFVVTGEGARAGDVIELMERVRRRVLDAFGVELSPEVVVWRRNR